jgi:hypothetical protein
MDSRISSVLGVVLIALNGAASAQEMPNPQAMQAQVQRIVQERPREAEAAARAFLQLIAMQRDLFPVEDRLAELETLKRNAPDVYWHEVAQLTVQFDMVQNLVRRDSARAAVVTHMFGLEVLARTLQRAYRAGSEAQRAQYRNQLETLIGGHFDLENQLRLLEIKDIERRLTDVRAETQRRIDRRAEFVRWAVDDIIRDALRPQ